MSDKNNQTIQTKTHSSSGMMGDFIGDEVAQFWLASLIDSAEDAIVGKTLDGVIKSWNKAAERILVTRRKKSSASRF
jgi:PAS domain-containing protein